MGTVLPGTEQQKQNHVRLTFVRLPPLVHSSATSTGHPRTSRGHSRRSLRGTGKTAQQPIDIPIFSHLRNVRQKNNFIPRLVFDKVRKYRARSIYRSPPAPPLFLSPWKAFFLTSSCSTRARGPARLEAARISAGNTTFFSTNPFP